MRHSFANTLPDLRPVSSCFLYFLKIHRNEETGIYIMAGDSAVVIKTRKFKKNPLLARKQVGFVASFAISSMFLTKDESHVL